MQIESQLDVLLLRRGDYNCNILVLINITADWTPIMVWLACHRHVANLEHSGPFSTTQEKSSVAAVQVATCGATSCNMGGRHCGQPSQRPSAVLVSNCFHKQDIVIIGMGYKKTRTYFL